MTLFVPRCAPFISAIALAACSLSSAVHAQVVLIAGPTGIKITEQDLQADALRVPEAARNSVFGKSANVSTAATNLYTRRMLAQEAEQNGLARDPQVAAALQIAHDKVLSDARIARMDVDVLPADSQKIEALVELQYKANPEAYRVPEQRKLRHILIPADAPNAEATATKILTDLQAGADFAQLAQTNSKDPGSASKGGDLGFVQRGSTVPPFDQAAWALTKPGELSPVVKSTFGYHVIRIEEIKPATVKPFGEVKAELISKARNKLIEEARAAKFQALMQGIQVDNTAAEAVSAKFR